MFKKSIPNIITLSTLICGFFSMIVAIEGYVHTAIILIFLAAILDTLDGFVARKLSVSSEFGAELDSLCDAINFGVVPAFLFYWFNFFNADPIYHIATAFFAICVVLRLAIFNIRSRCEELKYGFVGIPSPAAALLLLTPIMINFEFTAPLLENKIFLSIWALSIGFSMILPWPTPSFKNISPALRLGLVALAIESFSIAVLTHSFWLFAANVTLLYLLSIFVYWLSILFQKKAQ